MRNKKTLAVIVACSVVVSGLIACSAEKSTSTDKKSKTVVVTQAVTNADGEVVTEQSGEVVTEVVTDANGLAVTKVQDETDTTKSDSTTTTKKGSTQSNDEVENSTETADESQNATNNKFASTTKGTTKQSASTTEVDEYSDYIKIQLQENRTAKSTSSDVSISTGKVIINTPGDYLISSTTDVWYGQIIVKLKNTEQANIRFENVNVKNDTCNVIQFIDSSIDTDRSFIEAEATVDTAADDEISAIADNDKAPNIDISFPEGTSSSFTSTANGNTGVIYNESKLTIKGKGSCAITCDGRKANNCICSTKSITIKNVNLNLTTAQHESTESLAKTSGSAKGIFTYSKVNVESGTINIKSNGDCVRCNEFNVLGGTLNFKSSACDGIDADDAITISDGSVSVVALEKYSFKVRRVNNSENGRSKGVRSGKDDGFRINGGIVVGESKKISSLASKYQSDGSGSSQASITCKIVKSSAGTDEAANESKTPGQFTIGTLNKTSTNKCTKYLYSSSKVKKGTEYKVSANGQSTNVSWTGNFGVAKVVSSTGK